MSLILFGHIVLHALINYCFFMFVYFYLSTLYLYFILFLCNTSVFVYDLCLCVMMFHGSFVLVLFPIYFHDSNKF